MTRSLRTSGPSLGRQARVGVLLRPLTARCACYHARRREEQIEYSVPGNVWRVTGRSSLTSGWEAPGRLCTGATCAAIFGSCTDLPQPETDPAKSARWISRGTARNRAPWSSSDCDVAINRAPCNHAVTTALPDRSGCAVSPPRNSRSRGFPRLLASYDWSGRGDSNPRPQPWQARNCRVREFERMPQNAECRSPRLYVYEN